MTFFSYFSPSNLYVLDECFSRQQQVFYPPPANTILALYCFSQQKPPFFSFEQIVLYFPKGSPLRPHFDVRIRRLQEGGLVDKWIRDASGVGRKRGGGGADERAKQATRIKRLALEELK